MKQSLNALLTSEFQHSEWQETKLSDVNADFVDLSPNGDYEVTCQTHNMILVNGRMSYPRCKKPHDLEQLVFWVSAN